jgi:hypothetical protein
VVASALRELDEFLPDYEFSERHSIRVHAPPERIDAAVRSLAVEDAPGAGVVPFSGLTRILFLREVRRRAEAHA